MTLCQSKGSPRVPKLPRLYSWKVETVSKGLFCHSSIVTEHFTHNPRTASKWRKNFGLLISMVIVNRVQILPGLAARIGPSRAQRVPLPVGFLSRRFLASATTFSITTLIIMTFSIMTLSITALSITVN
jgi:hypothetical protein